MPKRTNDTTDRPLTQRELDIMSVLWEKGEATISQLRDAVDPDLAYTTVSTMVRLLELKAFVSHHRGEGKTHVYFPIIGAERAGRTALRRIVDKIYGGSPIRLLAHLVEQRRLSADELARMRSLLKQTPAQKKRR
jgi:BlaI family transcriptional regulator, penicillinase repressor